MSEEEKKAKNREYQKAWYQKNKDKVKKRANDWYWENRDTAIETLRAYREKNKESIKAQQRQHYAGNREEYSVRTRADRAANPEREKARRKKYKERSAKNYREYRAKHLEELKRKKQERYYSRTPEQKAIDLAKNREYCRKNRDKLNARNAKYRKQEANKIKKRIRTRERKLKKRGIEIKDRVAIADWEKSWRSQEVVSCHWCKGEFAPKECHVDHVMPLCLGGAHVIENLVHACAQCNIRKNRMHPDDWVALLEIEKNLGI